MSTLSLLERLQSLFLRISLLALMKIMLSFTATMWKSSKLIRISRSSLMSYRRHMMKYALVKKSLELRIQKYLEKETLSRESARSLMRSAMCCRKHMMMLRLTRSQKMKKLTMIYPLSLLKYMIILVPTKQAILHLLLSVHVKIRLMTVLLSFM